MAYWLIKSAPCSWSWDVQVGAGERGTAWNGVRAGRPGGGAASKFENPGANVKKRFLPGWRAGPGGGRTGVCAGSTPGKANRVNRIETKGVNR